MKLVMMATAAAILATPTIAQDEFAKALQSAKIRWETCAARMIEARKPNDDWNFSNAHVEGAFSDCASEEQYLLSVIDIVFVDPSLKRRAIAMHYKDRLDRKTKAFDDQFERIARSIGKK